MPAQGFQGPSLNCHSAAPWTPPGADARTFCTELWGSLNSGSSAGPGCAGPPSASYSLVVGVHGSNSYRLLTGRLCVPGLMLEPYVCWQLYLS